MLSVQEADAARTEKNESRKPECLKSCEQKMFV